MRRATATRLLLSDDIEIVSLAKHYLKITEAAEQSVKIVAAFKVKAKKETVEELTSIARSYAAKYRIPEASAFAMLMTTQTCSGGYKIMSHIQECKMCHHLIRLIATAEGPACP